MRRLLIVLAVLLGLTACGREAADQPALSARQQAYYGDWYGWMEMTAPDGEDYGVDVCGSVELQEDGTGTLEIWRCGESRKTGALASGALLIDPSGTGAVTELEIRGVPAETLEYYGGSQSLDIESGDMAVRPLLDLQGTCRSEEGDISFELSLRPWGQDWSDVRRLYSGDMLPNNYEDWYLPLIREEKPMPG